MSESSLTDIDKEILRLHRVEMDKNKAFRLLVSTYKKRLYYHIRRIVIRHDHADDVTQNTFIKVFSALDSFKGESKLYSWLYRIATNEALNFVQREARFKGSDIEEIQYRLGESLHGDPLYSGDAIQMKLQQALLTLPEKQRVVFNLKYFEGMKYNDMSEVLETSVGSLKASYHHAVKKIELYIKENAES